MIKLALILVLVGSQVSPSLSCGCICSSIKGLCSRTKAVADTVLFATDVVTDLLNGMKFYTGPTRNATGTVNETRVLLFSFVEAVVNGTRMNETEVGNSTCNEGKWDGSIRKAHPVWGATMLAIPFLPMMLVGPMLAWSLTEKYGATAKIVGMLVSILLSLPFTALATPLSVLFVITVGVLRVISPVELPEKVNHWYGVLKTAEISLESALQACVGLYIVFVLGYRKDDIGLQMLGLLVSIISLTKGVAEYQITAKHKEESSSCTVIKSVVFILPHTMVRVISYALIAGFLQYYSLIIFAILLITNAIIAVVTARKYSDDPRNSLLFVSLLAGLCTPFCMEPKSFSHHRYLRRSLLSTNLLLLACLLFINFLPSIFHPAALIKTPGLGHLHFESLTCANDTTLNPTGAASTTEVDSTDTVREVGDFSLKLLQQGFSELNVTAKVDPMWLSHEFFSDKIFPPLFILTVIVTVESVLVQFPRFPTPYRWFDIYETHKG